MEITMNSQGSGGGRRSTLCYSVVADPGEASSTGFEDFLEMFGARHSSGDLFDLVRQGGAGVGSSMEVQLTRLRLPSPSPPVALPPSEDDMAAWLYPFVSGQELAVVAAGHDDHQQPSDDDDAAGLAAVDDASADHKRESPPNMEDKYCGGAEDAMENGCGSRKKTTGGARTRSSHPAETHNLTEKRRRSKINEKLKTLRQLVPGCDDKSNQASTLDQTIQHIKSLQQKIQAMSSFGCGGMKLPAVYPVVPPPYYQPAVTGGGIAAGLPPPATLAPAAVLDMTRGHAVPPPAMAPFGSLLPPAHHHAPSCCCGTSLCTRQQPYIMHFLHAAGR